MEAIGGFAVFIMVLAVFAVIFIAKSVRVVPQQEAWVVERFGKFHTVPPSTSPKRTEPKTTAS